MIFEISISLRCRRFMRWGGTGDKHAGEGGGGEETPAVKAYLFRFRLRRVSIHDCQEQPIRGQLGFFPVIARLNCLFRIRMT